MVKKHWLAFAVAVAAGSLTCFPQLLAIQRTEDFQGVYKTVSNDETYYLARARDIIDGHPFLANPYIAEYKEGQPMQVWLPDYLLAKPLAVFGIDLHHGYLAYDFLLPFILVMLTYVILYMLTTSAPLSFLGSAFLHLDIFLHAFNRNPSPQFNFIFWLALFAWWLVFLKKSTVCNAVVLGILFGSLFYIYPYYWTFYVAFFIVFVSAQWLLRRSCPYKKYALAAAVAFIIAWPYFVSVALAMRLPYYGETLSRVGMINTHFPSGSSIIAGGVLILLLFYILYKKGVVSVNVTSILLASGILAAMLVVNQHVITGQNIFFSSHYWMLSAFCFAFALIYLWGVLLSRLKTRSLKITLLLVASIFVLYRPAMVAAVAARGEAVVYGAADRQSQRYAPVFAWLNEHTARDEVVFADQALSALIPVYTANNVFYFGMAGLHFISDDEFHERFILNNYWEDFDQAYALQNEFGIWGLRYQAEHSHNQSKNKLRRVFGLPLKNYEKIPSLEMASFLQRAHAVQSGGLPEQLSKYNIDYVIWDTAADTHWRVDELPLSAPLYETNGIIVYRFQPAAVGASAP